MDPRRTIPSVDRLLASPAFEPLLRRAPRTRIVDLLQALQRELRSVPSPGLRLSDESFYAEEVGARLARLERSSLVPVINATGVVLHTNLGRAPLARAAVDAMARVAAGYAALEYDLDEGRRGSRYVHCAGLLRELTGAEDALVVNNNAAALVLSLATQAGGSSPRDVLVSRGELVEIGDSFRIAEIVERSGARLVEVGATNRTHARDYAAALGESTGAILKVNRSNFRVTGFVAEATIEELVALDRGDVSVVVDLGSGLLVEPGLLGLPPEPTPAGALRAGADVVTMSGDKLLGGPQAGIVLGRAELVTAMRRNPLCRALRPDKLTLAALEATLRLYLEPDRAVAEIPALRMLRLRVSELEARARAFAARLAGAGIAATLQRASGAVGGGAYPEVELPGVALAFGGPRVAADGDGNEAGKAVLGPVRSAAELERRLRQGSPAVLARILADRVLLDLRTVAPDEEADLLAAVVAAHA